MSTRKATLSVLKIEIEGEIDEPADIKYEPPVSSTSLMSIKIEQNLPAASPSAPPSIAFPSAHQPFKCSICKQSFGAKAELTAHVKDHFKVYECPICQRRLIGNTQYEYHQLHVHGADDAEVYQPKVDQTRACRYCNASFTAAEMVQHVSAAHPDRVKCFKCEYCDERLPSQSQKNIHLHMEHSQECVQHFMACDICGRVCRNREAVLEHRRTHEEDKDFRCKTCGKSFTRRTNLESHARTHTGERPFKCEICPKTFTHVSGLNCHRRVHTKERPYQCPFCDKSYMHSTDLRRHRRSHGREEKRFECELCDRKFFERKFLIVHMRSHREVTSKVINIEMKVLSKEEAEDAIVEADEDEETMFEEYII